MANRHTLQARERIKKFNARLPARHGAEPHTPKSDLRELGACEGQMVTSLGYQHRDKKPRTYGNGTRTFYGAVHNKDAFAGVDKIAPLFRRVNGKLVRV